MLRLLSKFGIFKFVEALIQSNPSMLDILIRVEALLIEGQAERRRQVWHPLRLLFAFSSILLWLSLHQNSLFDVGQKIKAHVIYHLSEPFSTLVASWGKIDLNHPWAQLLVKNQVESVNLKCTGSLLHCILRRLESGVHYLVNLRP